MTENVNKAMNDQINLEMYSGYLYLSLSIHMEQLNYKGYAQWLARHYMEEFDHARDFISFMQKRNSLPILQDIKAETVDFKEPLDVAKAVLAHEQKVTQSIYQLHDTAKKDKDYATEVFMHKYIEEQVEEEDIAQEIVDRFTLAADNIAARYAVDKSLRDKCNC